ncbi:hypothetical protein HDV01_002914 [Terramyces sp. JEL0728]|nr:hypothetical protein HDV01_002914 [Terramyces sp. JEL0728]
MTSIESFFTKCIPASQQINLPTTVSRKRTTVAPSKYTIDQVLSNELPSPLSFKGFESSNVDFMDFLKEENCPEKLEFIAEVQDYKKAAAIFFESKLTDQKSVSLKENVPEDSVADYKSKSNTDLTKPANINNLDSKLYDKNLDALKVRLSNIIDLYVTINSERDLLLPDQIRIVLQNRYTDGHLNPSIFDTAAQYCTKILAQNSFLKFLRQKNRVSVSGITDFPKLTINQIVLNESSSPLSQNDFMQFLKKDLCEENLEFLIDVVKYQMTAVKFFPKPVVKGRERGLSTAPPPIYLDRGTTINGESPTDSEPTTSVDKMASASLPSPEKPDDLTEQEYQEQLSKIKTSILELINKYVKDNSHREINLPTTIRRPLLAHIAQAKYHPDILNPAYEHIAHMLKTNSLNKFLKAGTDILNANNIIEGNILLKNSRSTQLSEENLKFLVAVSDYEKLAKGLFPTPIPMVRMSTIVRGATVSKRDSKLPTTFEETDYPLDKLFFPEKPNNLSEDDYQKHVQKVKDANQAIHDQYISESAPSEINIPTKIKKPLLSKISKNVLHPDIYRESKKHIFDMMQQNNLTKFLKTTYKDGLSKGWGYLTKGLSSRLENPSRKKLDKLLLDELQPPYSYIGFSEFCHEMGCQPQLELLRAIIQYQKVAIQVFGMANPHGRRRESSSATITGPSTTPLNSTDGRDSVATNSNEALYTAQPKKPANMKPQDYEALVKKIEFMFSEIVHQYLRSQDAKLIIPSELSKPLLLKFERRQYHPDIFTKCYDCFAHDLNTKAWWVYEQKIEELINREGILLLCEENLEFLKSALKYQHEATPLYPHPIIKPAKKVIPKEHHHKKESSHVEDSPVVRGADFNSQSLTEFLHNSQNPAHSLEIVVPKAVMPPYLTQSEFETRKQNLREMLTDIVETFMKPDSIREINLPTNIRKPFFKLFDHGLYHPHILNEAVDHITNMIKTNNLGKFWKYAYDNIPKMKVEESLARTNSGVIKSNIKQIVLNELPPPYSVQGHSKLTVDFMKFLKNEHTEENLEFLLAIINYHKLSSPYYPNPLNLQSTSPLAHTGTLKQNDQPSFVLPVQPSSMTGEKYKELMVQLKSMCQSIVDTYIKSESVKEINIIERQRKQIINELSSGNYHPEIWKPTFEHIANLLRTNSLTKFLKSAKV